MQRDNREVWEHRDRRARTHSLESGSGGDSLQGGVRFSDCVVWSLDTGISDMPKAVKPEAFFYHNTL